MNWKRTILCALGTALLVTGGFLLPKAVFAYQDYRFDQADATTLTQPFQVQTTSQLSQSLLLAGNLNDNVTLETSQAQRSKKEVKTLATDALTLLNTGWDSYTDDEKFPAAGGDMSEANMKDDAPGNVALDDADTVAYLTSFPADMVDKLDAAASLMHMMNANTFTCGAFRLKDAADADAVCAAIRDGLNSKQWMCGFPDKMVIAKVSGCIVSVYGAEDLVNTFRDKLTAAYENAEIVYDEAIAF